ncbi:MAG: hotdog fold thioesterase [Flavobacteriaceae bacterium]|nr:hotdog fold thioesterase [Flavobacteriaceae bacterium]
MDTENLLEKLNSVGKNTLMETLDIKFIEVDKNKVVATMPVTTKVHQPDGVLHGGATVALAETVGSYASFLSVDKEKQMVRGIEISANHLRSIREGMVIATATPIHKGRTTQLWEIKIVDEKENLISLCKLTTIVLLKE